MAITINVTGNVTGGGSQQQTNQQSQQNIVPPPPTGSQQNMQYQQPSAPNQQGTQSQQPQPIQQAAPSPQPIPQPSTQPNPQPSNQQGTQSQQPSQPQQPAQTTPQPSNQHGTQTQQQVTQNNVTSPMLPTSDLIVQDIRREMASRGIALVPGTSNFSMMMNEIRIQQRNALNSRIDVDVEARRRGIDSQEQTVIYEISRGIEEEKRNALAKTNDPLRQADIINQYDRKLNTALNGVYREFDAKRAELAVTAKSEKDEVEQRLTEAIQRLTEELSQGNEDSYLNNLRAKYQEAVKRRDDAATEEEAREASREAAKIKERIDRTIGDSSSNVSAMKWFGVAGTALSVGGNMLYQADLLRDRERWGLGLDQASSILSGNAFNAIRQRNAIESQQVSNWWRGGGAIGGAAIGALIGSLFGGVGAIPGYAIGGTIGTFAGQLAGSWGADYWGGNRERLRQDYRVQAADLWRQEEQRMSQFNDLAMLTRGNNPYMQFTRNWYINQSQDPLLNGLMNGEFGNQSKPIVDASAAFNPYNKEGLDLYDLGYTSPEFAQKAAQRIRQRGFVDEDSVNNALYADALERVFSLSSGALGQLSAYDRFGRNNANQDFANLATTLASLGTTGMREGAWARSDEFAGYMSQLQSSQRGTFLTVDNQRAARQVATGQALFGDKFGNEAMQAIQAVNNQVQNPGQGFTRTLLYDVIQELYPDTRGDLRKIQMAMYDESKQNEIQTAFAQRVASIYGSPDTTTGFLAFKEIYGIENPNLLNPIAQQMVSGGGLEAKGLEKANKEELVKPIAQGGYTPEVTKKLNIAADSQMTALLNRMDDMVSISNSLLRVLSKDTNDTLKKALDELKK